MTFDSKIELQRYIFLEDMASIGKIKNLDRQVKYDLSVNGIKITSYKPDFVYDLPDGTLIVEDVKSPATAKLEGFRIRCKLMKAIHGIDVKTVMGGGIATL